MKLASDGKTMISSDGLRQFRQPSYKPKLDKTQANFEWRKTDYGKWQSNGHLDIIN
jgi:filamentous hemagglutinin